MGLYYFCLCEILHVHLQWRHDRCREANGPHIGVYFDNSKRLNLCEPLPKKRWIRQSFHVDPPRKNDRMSWWSDAADDSGENHGEPVGSQREVQTSSINIVINNFL